MLRLSAILVVFAVSTADVAAQDLRQERISFAPGSSGATITGRITGYNITDYVLGAGQGQQMTVDFAPDNPSAYFNVLKGDDPTALFVGSSNGNHYSGALPASGDYRIRVYLVRAAARRNESANYRLSITIGKAGTPAPDYADGLSGGPDWWEVTGLTVGDPLNVRSGPGTENGVIGQLANGDRVRNKGCRMNIDVRWCRVELAGDQPLDGWVAGRYLREAAAPGPAPDYADGIAGGPDWWQVANVSAGDTLNVRAGPGTGNPVIGQLGNGDRVRNHGCQMNGDTKWCNVELPGDQVLRGWVAGRYLREAANQSASGEASGSIPCALSEGQPMGICTFRVSRGQNGTASLWVALPSGGERYLDFREGKLVGSDPGKQVHHEKSGDLNLIWIDGVERYEIPDAAIFGG